MLRVLHGPDVRRRSTDSAVRPEVWAQWAGVVESCVGRLCQHLEKLRDGKGKERDEVVRVERSTVMTGAVEKGVISRKLQLRLQDCLRARTPIFEEKEVKG